MLDNCINRSDTAGETINIEWHVCPRDTSLQIFQSYTNSCRRANTNPESFPDRIIFTSMFNDITDYESDSEDFGHVALFNQHDQHDQLRNRGLGTLTKFVGSNIFPRFVVEERCPMSNYRKI